MKETAQLIFYDFVCSVFDQIISTENCVTYPSVCLLLCHIRIWNLYPYSEG